MTAKELRIGNWVEYNGETIKVATINQDFNDEPYYLELYDSDDMFCQANLDECNPIPLTEEWLQRLGLHPKINYIKGLYIENGLAYFEDNEYGHEEKDEIECKYVHQLQNLYFALTGEELELDKK